MLWGFWVSGFFLFVSCKLQSCLLYCSVVSLTAFSFTCPQKIFSVEVLTKSPAEPSPACCLPCLVSTCTAVITPWVFDGSASWFLLVPAPFCITKVIYSPTQLEPCFPPQLGVTLKNNHDLPAVPLMGSAGAGGGVPCITNKLFTAPRVLGFKFSLSKDFDKEERTIFFPWLLQMKKLLTWELWVIFMEMGRAVAIFMAVTEALESIFYWYVFTCPQKSYCTLVERTLFRFSILKSFFSASLLSMECEVQYFK